MNKAEEERERFNVFLRELYVELDTPSGLPFKQVAAVSWLWAKVSGEIPSLSPPVFESEMAGGKVQVTWMHEVDYVEAEVDPEGRIEWIVLDRDTRNHQAGEGLWTQMEGLDPLLDGLRRVATGGPT